MAKNLQWLILAIFSFSVTLLTGCAETDNGNPTISDEEGVTNQVYDPSTYWLVSDKVAFMSGIETMPADFQTALKQRFPKQTDNMEEAQVIFFDMDKFNEDLSTLSGDKLKEVSEFFGKLMEMELEHHAAIVMLSAKGLTYSETDGTLDNWKKLFMATHGYGDTYYLLDEQEEADPVVANQINSTKDTNYWNTRLSHFVEWLIDYDAEQEDNSAALAPRMSNRADNSDNPFDQVKMNMSTGVQRINFDMPFSLHRQIDKAGGSDPDRLDCDASVSVRLRITPMYMLSANGDYAGDYYYVRSTITPHNQEMWRPFIGAHGWTRNRVYGYWLDYMKYQITLCDKNYKSIDGVEYFNLPIPQNKISSTEYGESFDFGLSGQVKVGPTYELGKPTKVAGEAQLGFSARWSESVKYKFENINYVRNTSTPTVEYTWSSYNVELNDDWDNMYKYFKPDTHSEFDCENIWMWHVKPTASNGIKDNSNVGFNISVLIMLSYSSWHHWRGTAQFDDNKVNHLVVPARLGMSAVTPPNRETWGLIEVTNISDYTMRNVKILQNNKVVKTIDGTYAKDKAAVAAMKEGTYSITFEYINANTNQVVKSGTFNNVVVKMGRDKESATTKLSTGTAILK